jgi:hypothetical protein
MNESLISEIEALMKKCNKAVKLKETTITALKHSIRINEKQIDEIENLNEKLSMARAELMFKD